MKHSVIKLKWCKHIQYGRMMLSNFLKIKQEMFQIFPKINSLYGIEEGKSGLHLPMENWRELLCFG